MMMVKTVQKKTINKSIYEKNQKIKTSIFFPSCLLLNIGLIRMNILMLDTRNVEQTKMYVCTLEEFILVDIWIHCCTKLK